MMVVDTSAVIAVLGREPEGVHIAQTLAEQSAAHISAVNFVEAATVAQRWGDNAATVTLDQFFTTFGVSIAAVDARHASLAREAYLKYGKGRGHPAQLNICDCFAYALAKSLDAPLLFKGMDFPHTDVKRAIP